MNNKKVALKIFEGCIFFEFMDLNFISVLLAGVQNNDVAEIDRVVQCGSLKYKNFNAIGSSFDSLLHLATYNMNYQICEKLLKIGADVNMLNGEDRSPLHVLEENANFDICQLLLKKRKTREERIKYTKALHDCARNNDLTMCKTYIKSVDVNETDIMMRTPLHVAMIHASDEICDLLLKHGADISVKDSYNDSPIQLAFYYNRRIFREKFLLNLPYFG